MPACYCVCQHPRHLCTFTAGYGTRLDREQSLGQDICSHSVGTGQPLVAMVVQSAWQLHQRVPLTVPSTGCTTEPAPNWPLAFLQHPGRIQSSCAHEPTALMAGPKQHCITRSQPGKAHTATVVTHAVHRLARSVTHHCRGNSRTGSSRCLRTGCRGWPRTGA